MVTGKTKLDVREDSTVVFCPIVADNRDSEKKPSSESRRPE